MNSSGGDNDASVLHKSTVVMQYVDKGFKVVFGVVPFPTVVHGGLAGCSTQDPGTVTRQYDFQPAGAVLHSDWLRDAN